MISIAQIAIIVSSGLVGTMPTNKLTDAHYQVMFARDPAFLGEEPHLRHEVDPCGHTDEELVAMEQVIWTEMQAREEARIAAVWGRNPILYDLAA